VSHDRRDVAAGDGVNALARGGPAKEAEEGRQGEQAGKRAEPGENSHQLPFDFSFASVITR
jgi:hypothetical protein